MAFRTKLFKPLLSCTIHLPALLTHQMGQLSRFTTTTGILQGDTLAPYLFVIVVDYILRQSVDHLKDLGLDVKPHKTSRDRTKYLTDLDYADDIALTSVLLENAQQLLVSLEDASAKVGLMLNAKKTEYLRINGCENEPPLKSRNGTLLKSVDDFKYLGSYVVESRKDFETRKAQAWSACNRLNHIWQSNISLKSKIAFFKACVESILLYGSETWSMSKLLQNRLDGAYTRLLMRVKNISWRQHKTKDEIYGNLHPISDVVAIRRTRFAGHCYRAKDQVVSDVLLLRLQRPVRGKRPFSYLDSITRDSKVSLDDLPTLMNDRDRWKDVVKNCSTVVD